MFAELEDGYEDYAEYRGDGGHDPKHEPSVSGYVRFENGVRSTYASGFKDTPDPKWRFEIVGTDAYILNGDDGAFIHRGKNAELITPPPLTKYGGLEGIPAGVREMVNVVADGGTLVSPGREALKTVEIMLGFLASQARGNVRVDISALRG